MKQNGQRQSQAKLARLGHLNLGIMAGFLAVSLMLTLWSVVQAGNLATREDNPRQVETERRIRRGRILDVNQVVLAETTGPAGDPLRLYPIPNIGPAVGYYSFRHGTAGIEEGFDTVLRGDDDDFWTVLRRQSLHETQSGRDIRLTLDADWQRVADALMQDQDGVVLLLTVQDGAIRVMVSHPAYDPNRLDEQFDDLVADDRAPLLNRAVQGQYQPGLALQPFIIAGAREHGLLRLDDPVELPDRPVWIGSLPTRCAAPPPQPAVWSDVLTNACPHPMRPLGNTLGAANLDQIFASFGLTMTPTLPLTSDVPPAEPVADPALAAIGQDTLIVSPLQIALAWTALAREGEMPIPKIVAAVQDETGQWHVPPRPTATPPQAVSAETARRLLNAFGQHDNLIREFSALILSGPAGSTNGWYMGLAPAGDPHYAVLVVVEDSHNRFTAEQIGRTLLREVLSSE